MQTHVTFRHLDHSDALHAHTEAALDKLGRVYARIDTAHVTLSEDGLEKKVEIRLAIPGPDVFCSERGASHQEAVDACVESLKRVLVKQKEQRHAHDPERTVWH